VGEEQFKIIFTGQLQENVTADQVVTQFSQTFNIPLTKAQKIIAVRHDMVLKTNLEHAKAYKFKRLLEQMGMRVKLQNQNNNERWRFAPGQDPELEKREAKPERTPSSSEMSSWSLEPIEEEIPQKTSDGIELQNLSQAVGKEIKAHWHKTEAG